ncbi:Aste57867_24182 [Aphanomyces stellatus]|uniref:Aste57867_24182 protein n=1 Tax=Aphanomyces stellatus TaxID=120398 RepID=A0A485LPT1_9STRA|nr:hypothetical protein As57867_024108 [Aphanomyces stellatus]VFU00824.1 Aste57867_24182 [Aphanomyces stellatus]
MAVPPPAPSGQIPRFIKNLYFMLDKASSEIVTWTQDSLAFVILDQTAFEETLLPRHFSHRKWSKFASELSLYGFHTRKRPLSPSRRGDHLIEYSHVDFQRGNIKGLRRIKTRRKQELELERRVVVDEIEDTILDIKRHIVHETATTNHMTEFLSCMFDPPPPPLSLPLLPPPGFDLGALLMGNPTIDGHEANDSIVPMYNSNAAASWLPLPLDERFLGGAVFGATDDDVQLDPTTFALIDHFIDATSPSLTMPGYL